MKYELLNGDIHVIDDAGVTLWRGRPLGQPVKAVSPLPRDEGAIVLLDYTAVRSQFENLLRLGPRGEVVWQAPLPQSTGDSFVDFTWRDGALIAHTWSGHLVEIDVESGQPKRSEFTK